MPTIPTLEAKEKLKFIDELRRCGGYVSNLTASMYMSGQPDMAITTKHGAQFQCEAKVWRNVKPPVRAEQLTALLKGPQINVIVHQLWKRGAYVPLIAFEQTGMCHVINGRDSNIITATTIEMAQMFASITKKDLAPDV